MKRVTDINQWAAEAVAAVTGLEVPRGVLAALIKRQETAKAEAKAAAGKNPAAVALGRLGGLKGGKARAKTLSAKKRSEIARKGAKAKAAKAQHTEKEIIALMRKGRTSSQIAAALGLTPEKMAEHRKRIGRNLPAR